MILFYLIFDMLDFIGFKISINEYTKPTEY